MITSTLHELLRSTRTVVSAGMMIVSTVGLVGCDESTEFRRYDGAAESLTFFAAHGDYRMRFETLSNTCGETRPSGDRIVRVLSGSMEDGRPFLTFGNAPVVDLGVPGVEDVGEGSDGVGIGLFMSRSPDRFTQSGLAMTDGVETLTVEEASETRLVIRQTGTFADPDYESGSPVRAGCEIVRRIELERETGANAGI